MAKDPAFLFYPGDYISGTMHLDFECKGAYIDLLMLQFQRDKLDLHMIKHMLGDMYEHIWSHLSDKFQTDGHFFWNERLRIEKEKRAKYCGSRSDNRSSKNHMLEHMSQHMENININVFNKDKTLINMTKQKSVEIVVHNDQKATIVYLDDGNIWQANEIEKFLLKNEIAFEGFLMKHRILAKDDNFKRMIQYFVIHFQTSGDKKTSTELTKHCRNWLNTLNGQLEKILYPEKVEKKKEVMIPGSPKLRKLE